MKVVLYMAMTANGYIATEKGETPWSEAAWESYYKIARRFKAIIVGRKTYEIMKGVNEFRKIGNPLTVVLSNKKGTERNDVLFVKTPQEALRLLQERGFTEALIGGGSRSNASFMEEGLIDEIILDVEPLLFGRGIRLFADTPFREELELKAVIRLSDQTVQLHYRVKKSKG